VANSHHHDRPFGIVNVTDYPVGANPVSPQPCLAARQGFTLFAGIRLTLDVCGEKAGDPFLSGAVEFAEFSGGPWVEPDGVG